MDQQKLTQKLERQTKIALTKLIINDIINKADQVPTETIQGMLLLIKGQTQTTQKLVKTYNDNKKWHIGYLEAANSN